jgi:hypothetical protein
VDFSQGFQRRIAIACLALRSSVHPDFFVIFVE